MCALCSVTKVVSVTDSDPDKRIGCTSGVLLALLWFSTACTVHPLHKELQCSETCQMIGRKVCMFHGDTDVVVDVLMLLPSQCLRNACERPQPPIYIYRPCTTMMA